MEEALCALQRPPREVTRFVSNTPGWLIWRTQMSSVIFRVLKHDNGWQLAPEIGMFKLYHPKKRGKKIQPRQKLVSSNGLIVSTQTQRPVLRRPRLTGPLLVCLCKHFSCLPTDSLKVHKKSGQFSGGPNLLPPLFFQSVL